MTARLTRGCLLAVLLTAGAGLAADPPAAKALTAEQKEKLKERDRLIAETISHANAGRSADAMKSCERMTAICIEVFGDVHPDVASAWEYVGDLNTTCENWITCPQGLPGGDGGACRGRSESTMAL